MNSKEECLRKACEIVNGARARDYGSPEGWNFTLMVLSALGLILVAIEVFS